MPGREGRKEAGSPAGEWIEGNDGLEEEASAPSKRVRRSIGTRHALLTLLPASAGKIRGQDARRWLLIAVGAVLRRPRSTPVASAR